MSDEGELDLRSLNDEELTQQIHDDLYDGLKEEVEEGVHILLERGWTPYRTLTEGLVEGMRIVGIDFRDGILFVPEVLLAANAPQALEILSGPQHVDVLFSDVVMPGEMNGVQLAHRAQELRPGIKVLLASGYPMSALAERGLTDDMAFISKPYRWSELVDRLRRAGRRR